MGFLEDLLDKLDSFLESIFGAWPHDRLISLNDALEDSGWHIGKTYKAHNLEEIQGLDLIVKDMVQYPSMFAQHYEPINQNNIENQSNHNYPLIFNRASYNVLKTLYFGLEKPVENNWFWYGDIVDMLVMKQPIENIVQAETDYLVNLLNVDTGDKTFADDLIQMYYSMQKTPSNSKKIKALESFKDSYREGIDVGGNRTSSAYDLGMRHMNYIAERILDIK